MSKSNQVVCKCCGNQSWQSLELKQYGEINNEHGYYEKFRCTICGQVRTQIIKVINEQIKGVVL